MGISLLMLLLIFTVLTWGTKYAPFPPSIAVIVTVFEWAKPYIADNDIDGRPR